MCSSVETEKTVSKVSERNGRKQAEAKTKLLIFLALMYGANPSLLRKGDGLIEQSILTSPLGLVPQPISSRVYPTLLKPFTYAHVS